MAFRRQLKLVGLMIYNEPNCDEMFIVLAKNFQAFLCAGFLVQAEHGGPWAFCYNKKCSQMLRKIFPSDDTSGKIFQIQLIFGTKVPMDSLTV